jgi:hypothetical protein
MEWRETPEIREVTLPDALFTRCVEKLLGCEQ